MLSKVLFTLPAHHDFFQQLNNLFSSNISSKENTFTFNSSDDSFSPKISFVEASCDRPVIDFFTDETKIFTIELKNSTGKIKESPHKYEKITFNQFNEVFSHFTIKNIDHIGFNIPWFDEGIHPEIEKLRKKISKTCLYHSFPAGEPWDFILPASREEIENKKITNYQINRKPKIEIVSFDKSSTPLIQFDFSVADTFEKIRKHFPEGIAVPELKNIWVYLENPYNIDICMVINQATEKDWSPFFEKSRLIIE